MNDEIRAFVVDLVRRKSRIPPGTDVDSLDYIASGHVDSLGLIKFVADVEDRFGITIADQDIEGPDFRTVGGLVRLIRAKMGARDERG